MSARRFPFVIAMETVIVTDETDVANKAEIALETEDEVLEIEPGQKLRVEILAADRLIFDEGKYRLIYGDAVIDFKLVFDEVR